MREGRHLFREATDHQLTFPRNGLDWRRINNERFRMRVELTGRFLNRDPGEAGPLLNHHWIPR